MNLILRSKNINIKTKKITLYLTEKIPYLNILLVKNNSLNHQVIDYKSNILLYLKLLDLNNNKINGLDYNYSTLTKEGIGYFNDIKINQTGDFILLVEDINNQYKSDFIYVSIKNRDLRYSIKLIEGSNKIFKYNSKIYKFHIVDNYQQVVTCLENNTLPFLNLSIIYSLDHNKINDETINLQIKSNEEGYYHFIISGSEIVKMDINVSLDQTTLINKINIDNLSFKVDIVNDSINPIANDTNNIINSLNNKSQTLYSNKNYSQLSDRLYNIGLIGLKGEYFQSNDIYIRKKIWINNELQDNKSSDKLTNFETNLSCSEQLNYSLKHPQELSTIPIKVDNSIGSQDKNIPYFNPKPVFNFL